MTEDEAAVRDDRQHHRFVFRHDGIDAQLVYRTDGDRLSGRVSIDWDRPHGSAGTDSRAGIRSRAPESGRR